MLRKCTASTVENFHTCQIGKMPLLGELKIYIQYTELKLSCGNIPVVKILFIVMVALTFDPKINRVLVEGEEPYLFWGHYHYTV
jgi:hypothetical protein